jgi:hypothetical protein
MKAAVLLILAVPALAIGYYFAIALPANQRAALEFEKQKYEAEKQDKSRKASDELIANQSRKLEFDSCVEEADLEYWNYVKLNGKPIAGKPGAYNAPVTVWEVADKRKINAVAECHRLHDK